MTNDKISRVKSAIAECDFHIEREMTRYSEQNRDHDLIARYVAHKAKLLAMLEAA